MFRISCKNSVLQREWEGLPWWARLGGLGAGASQGCDRFPLLQKGHGAGTGSLQLPAWCCPPSCSSLTSGAGQSSGHSSCTTARLRSKHRHVSQSLWDANLISLFTLHFQVSHNKSQPMLGNPPPPGCLLVPSFSRVTLCCKQICQSLGLLIISVHD